MFLQLLDTEKILQNLTHFIAGVTEIAAAMIIGISVLIALYKFFKNFLVKDKISEEQIRLDLGKSLALGLEFLLGADIIKTVVAPSWQAIGMLAAIAVLRTGLNFFLGKEIQDENKRKLKERQG
jgi:uncharacterized membrane protein